MTGGVRLAVNDGYLTAWTAYDAPIGGMNDSGLGRRHGPEGIRKDTEPKTITTTRWRPFDPVSAPSETEASLLPNALKLWRHVPFLR